MKPLLSQPRQYAFRAFLVIFVMTSFFVTANTRADSQAVVDVESIAEKARDHYLKAYRDQIAQYKQRYRPGGPEVLLEVGKSAPYVYRLYRIDLASGAVKPPDLTEVNVKVSQEFPVLQFTQDKTSIEVLPFAWNGVEFEISPPLANDSQLQKWGLRWIDPEENANVDASGLGNYVHSITEPTTSGGATHFSVDFGSASMGCWRELFSLLRKTGAKHIKIHSKSLLEN